jgi:ACS family glucarate transporter-like MFS transporter
MNDPKSASAPGETATFVRYLVLSWLCVASLIAYMDRGCMAIAKEEIRADLDFSSDEMGQLFAAFFFTYGLLQIPMAGLAQRWGTRAALPVFSVCWSLATGMCGLVNGYAGLLIARLGMGTAEAGIFPCATSALGRWFPSTRRGWACGLLLAFMGVGGAVGSGLSGYIVQYLSWRWMFLLYTVPGVLWAIGFYMWFRDRPREHPSVNGAELAIIEEGQVAASVTDSGPVPWGSLLSSGALWLLGVQQFCRSFGLAFYMTDYPTFLKKAHAATLVESGNWNGTSFAAQVVGSMVGGMISDWVMYRTGSRWLSRKGLGLVSTLGGAVFMVAAYFAESLWLTGVLVAVSTLCLSLSNSCGYALTIDMGGKYVAPVFAIVNSLANFGYVVFPLLVPWLLKRSDQDWNVLLFLVAGAYLAAMLCWVFFNPYAQVVKDGAVKA